MLLATWNVLADAYVKPERYRDVEPGLLEPRARLDAVVRRAAGLDADVLCLQEVDARCAAALTAHLAPLGYTGRWRKKAGGRPDGCALFWRGLAATGEDHLVQPDGSGHVVQATLFPSLGVVTTHLKWSSPSEPLASRWSMRQAEALVAWLAPLQTPLLVCGDLNVRADDPVLARLAEAGLRDVFSGADRPHTCCAGGESAKVDHVLVRDLDARPAARQFDQFGVRVLPDAREPSDHVPLLVEW
jgi:endonuclease/exonuclease/phosphatase family metal-dependent hydrolase